MEYPDERKDLLKKEAKEDNELGELQEPITLTESFIGRRRPVFRGEYFGSRKNLYNTELPDSPIPTEIAMDEHFFPEE